MSTYKYIVGIIVCFISGLNIAMAMHCHTTDQSINASASEQGEMQITNKTNHKMYAYFINSTPSNSCPKNSYKDVYAIPYHTEDGENNIFPKCTATYVVICNNDFVYKDNTKCDNSKRYICCADDRDYNSAEGTCCGENHKYDSNKGKCVQNGEQKAL